MELRRYLAILRQRAWLIVLAVVVGVAYTAATTESTVIYTSRATLYVGATSFIGTDQRLDVSGDQNSGLSQLIRTFATMIDSTTIADEVVARTGLPRSPAGLVNATTAAPVPGTNILSVDVVDTDPAVAQAAATGFAEVFVERIAELEPPQPGEEGVIPGAPVRIFERAKLATVPTTTSRASRMFVAAIVGLVLSAGLILLGDYLDITVKSPADAEARIELPVLAAVPVLAAPDRSLGAPRVRAPDVGEPLEPAAHA
jgi:capsular polysaccharide biosynthesis protein